MSRTQTAVPQAESGKNPDRIVTSPPAARAGPDGTKRPQENEITANAAK
ncbi:hypothetical protein [Desulfovibrio sp. Huiquan2017]|nr:hypothetical protein [Desulfovibrio sp. Huiquan2017]